jgi:hypothetical protein
MRLDEGLGKNRIERYIRTETEVAECQKGKYKERKEAQKTSSEMCKERQAREEGLTSTSARDEGGEESKTMILSQREGPGGWSELTVAQGREEVRSGHGSGTRPGSERRHVHRCLPCVAADRRVGRTQGALIGGLLVRHLELRNALPPHTRAESAQKSPRGPPLPSRCLSSPSRRHQLCCPLAAGWPRSCLLSSHPPSVRSRRTA